MLISGVSDSRRIYLYIFVSIVIFLLWYSSLRRKHIDDLALEVKLTNVAKHEEHHLCSIDTCMKLDRCLYNMDKMSVFVQPMVKIKYPNGKELKVPESVEFNQIRQAIMNSEFVVEEAEKACLIVPGVDLLNLRKFKSIDEVQRVLEAISTLLPSNSNLLLFNFVGIQSLPHLKAIWASSSMDQYSLRRKFDVSVPMLRPYSLATTKNVFVADLTLKQTQNWAIVLRFASSAIANQLRDVLQKSETNATLIYLTEIKQETERDIRIVKDQHGDRRDYVDVLRHSTFTLIHDLVPGFQMLILDALQCGSIPVIITDDYLPPFHELIDWSRFSILLAKQNLPELTRILQSISSNQIEQMRQLGQRVYWKHLESASKVALSTLRLIERRLLPVEPKEFNGIDEDNVLDALVGESKKLWLNVPIRSIASNFTLILSTSKQIEFLEDALNLLWSSTRHHLHSILILWPSNLRSSDLHSLTNRLQLAYQVPIHFLDYDSTQISANFGLFVDSLMKRLDTSKDCWLFMDLDKNGKRPKVNSDSIEQSFVAWKENSDSILSFDPYADLKSEKEPVETLIENKRQIPFYHGAAFMHPHAAQDIAKSSSTNNEWARCSKVSSQSLDCSSVDRTTNEKCPEFVMEFCRPIFV